MKQRNSASLIVFLWIVGCLAAVPAANALNLTASTTSAPSGGTAEVDVTVSDATAVGALDIALRFDPAVLRYQSIEPGPSAASTLLEANEIEPGRLLIALATGAGLASDGQLLQIAFEVAGQNGEQSTVSFEAANAYHHEKLIDLPVTTVDGTVTVATQLPVTYLIGAGVAVVVLVLVVLLWRRRKSAQRQ